MESYLSKIKNPQTRRLAYLFILLIFITIIYKSPEIIRYSMNYNSVTIAISKEKLHRGQPLNETLIETIHIPKSDDKPEYFHDSEVNFLTNLDQYVSTANLEPGSKLTKKTIIPKDKNFINTLLKPNNRALCLKINQDQISKDLTGGWRVDISLTKGAQNNSTLILRNVKVLDIGREPDPTKNPENDNKLYIILELTPEDAEIVLTGDKSGTLNFLALSSKEIDEVQAPIKEEKQKTIKVLRGIYAK